jgi:RNA polymerase sigma-70 factor, ECF subfamily
MPETHVAADPEIDALVARAQAGELPAFNALVLRHQDALYSLALRMLGSRDAAEDATQEAFIRAYRRIDTFRGGNFRSWLFTIVANVSRDELRRRGRRPALSLDLARDDPDRASLDPPDPDPTPEGRALQSDLRRTLEDALARLPHDWREVVLLVDVHGLGYDEAAAAMGGLPVGTVKSRLSRARGRLRDLLRDAGERPGAPERQGT